VSDFNRFRKTLPAWDEAHLLQRDKAWDAIHRCLTDRALTIARYSNPLGKLILGRIPLYSDSQSYVVNLIEHGELSEISGALKTVTKEWMKTGMNSSGTRTIAKSLFPSRIGSTRGTAFLCGCGK
jgi:hypothetical protein